MRITDSATASNKRMDDMNKRMEDMRDFIRSENARLDQKLDRIAETMNAILGDHEQRIRAIEQRPR
ncbi:MAG TPA: hypothetical protein VG345_07260 [Bryobacteraceae bacterium]|nr:hypothetical protein [Bryobacteraceae bacterium]